MLDFKKFIKYSKGGPRYTSYPTAVEFSESFGYDEYISQLRSQSPNAPLSLYVHLPFCRNACYFCGCNVVFTSKNDKLERYIDYLEKELSLLSEHIDTKRSITQLHFGGGTPTFFSAQQLERIIVLIKSRFTNFALDAELSCEIDPRHLNEEQMKVLKDGGFNRVSFGIQDFDEKVQHTIHRVQSYDLTQNVIELSRKYGMQSVNVDLIYGLPYQSLESFNKTLEMSLSLNPDRFAVFNYAHVPWLKKTMRKIDEHTLPKPDEKLAILESTIEKMQLHDYNMVGMDHFAKPEDELFLAIEKGELHRNFQGYTTKAGADLIGIGLTSIGYGSDYYAQNSKSMHLYESSLDNGGLPYERGIKLSEDDKIRHYVIMELMSNFKLDIERFEKHFGLKFFEYFEKDVALLQPYIEDELLSMDSMQMKCSETGMMLIRNICMAFDAYMHQHADSKKTFSKTL